MHYEWHFLHIWTQNKDRANKSKYRIVKFDRYENTKIRNTDIIPLVTGDNVYGILKYESGVHRVQRVPATETQGRENIES